MNIFKREFSKTIKKVYVFFEFCEGDKSEYCVDLWKNIDWGEGGIVPMFKNKNKVAFYKIVKSYYSQGTSSMSDWAFGDDGKDRDFKFIYSINRNDVNL